MHAELDAILHAVDDEETVRDLLGLIAVATNDPVLGRLPVVHRFMAAVEREADGDVDAYFAKHPLPAAVLQRIQQLVRAELSSTSGGSTASLDRVTGRASSSRPPPAEAPAGSVRGGVFARVKATTR